MSLGTTSLNGYRARGARLRVLSETLDEIRVRYDTAVTVWTSEQWRRRPDTAAVSRGIHCDVFQENRRLVLDYGKVISAACCFEGACFPAQDCHPNILLTMCAQIRRIGL